VLRGDRVVLRPLEPRDAPALRAALATPEVAAWWGAVPDGFPLEDEPEATRFTVLVDEEIAGMVQYTEEREPDYRHAELDVFLHPDHHGHGAGTDAMARLARHLLEDRGHHRLILSVSVDNARAIRAYEKVGFRTVGVTEASWRDLDGNWRDELFMERVVQP
jgi:aminoglycoside 6'-N-acetyltransferase